MRVCYVRCVAVRTEPLQVIIQVVSRDKAVAAQVDVSTPATVGTDDVGQDIGQAGVDKLRLRRKLVHPNQPKEVGLEAGNFRRHNGVKRQHMAHHLDILECRVGHGVV